MCKDTAGSLILVLLSVAVVGKKCSRCRIRLIDAEIGNCQKCKESSRLYYQDNIEVERARGRENQKKRDRSHVNKLKRALHRKNPANVLIMCAKSRAKKYGIQFNITKEDITIPRECPILRIPLYVSDGKCSANSPTIDRIIPSLGYVKGNVQVISHRANTIKSNSTLEELKLLIEFLSRVV